MAAKDFLFGLGLFFGILAVILIVVFFLAWIFFTIVLVVCVALIIIIVILAVLALVFLFAIPYYAITKKPEVQYGGGYKLDEVKGKDEWEKPREEYKKEYSLKDMKDDKRRFKNR